MITRRDFLAAAAAFSSLMVVGPANAQDRIKVVATFSILADMVKNVGGDRIEVATLVGPNGDVHAFSPSPADAKTVAMAKVVFVNGLGLEGWLERLVKASGSKAVRTVATKGVKQRRMADAHDHGHGHGETDPHAWQSVANAKIYVANATRSSLPTRPAKACTRRMPPPILPGSTLSKRR
jgi:zinc/manganese transport system substrate-binding protein